MKSNFTSAKKQFLSGLFLLSGILLSSIMFGQQDVSSKTIEIKKSNTVSMKAIMQADKQKQNPQMLRSAKERKNKIEEFEKRTGRRLNPVLQKKKESSAQQARVDAADNAVNAKT